MEIVNFLRDNWQFVSTVLIDLIIIIIAVIKKKSISLIKDSSSISTLIDLVNEAEVKFGAKKGKEKMNYVFSEFAKTLDLGSNYIAVVRPAVEREVEHILSTPQRKEKS